ncbi:serine hydrolase domain-containing protein [Luteibacter sp. E-22]|uniref:serine hydrolase domain-containing protein n=1 Tax=Luteibacter sp. E-22 TaxID=3404050 RepID=UPI003CEA76FA
MHLGKWLAAATIACWVSLTPWAAGAQTAPPSPPDLSALDAMVMKRMTDAGMVGVGAAIIVDKKLVWMKGYGYADRERGTPFTPATVMNIGSISKTVTGTAMMLAVEEGKLSLDEDINTYLPFKVVNPYFPTVPITLRQLATHTSSISDRWPVYKNTYHYGGDSPVKLGDFLANYFDKGGTDYAEDNFVKHKPGTYREYSNIGAGLAGFIVERAVGEPLNTYTRRRIFAPLKMDDTAWFLSEVKPSKHARLYVSQMDLAIPIEPYGGTTYPDGGVRTSVADLSKLFMMILDNGKLGDVRVLKEGSVRAMRTLQFNASNKPDNVKLDEKNAGLFWESKFNMTRIGHGGMDPGLKTEMLSSLSGDIGVVLFTNTSVDNDGMKHYVALFEDLWKQAEAMKRTRAE